MKTQLLRLLCIVWVAACLLIIFGFSSESGNESDVTSLSFAEKLFTALIPGFQDLPEKEMIIENANVLIRKIGHMAEFAMLGCSLATLFYQYKWNTTARVCSALGVGVAAAVGDELHQLFVPGRSGQFTDVLIDSVGATIGIFLIVLVAKQISKYQKRKKEKPPRKA